MLDLLEQVSTVKRQLGRTYLSEQRGTVGRESDLAVSTWQFA